ncbi:DMT family transporter [Rhizobium sp. TRM95111]|uniref:DMT family transporter n=1 Tax=Rhizobium alarense TaxID=2846851 RepID=UPI001F422B3F|nr:DMT family transporter [Rhizobium alarense]MCF3639483.1 DMT family transporter [Rhizobium alarense]
MPIGIFCGLLTCALWGLTFVAPRAVEPFSAWDLTVARYGTFGAASLLLMLHPRFRPRGLSRRQWAVGLLLGGAGYVGYFVAAASAVRFAGAAIPPLVIGTMPVVLAIIANRRERTVPWRPLVPPLALIAGGVAVVNASALVSVGPDGGEAIALGLVSAVAALAIWVTYGLANAAVMRTASAPDGLHWTGVQGIGAAIGSIALLPLTSLASPHPAGLPDIVPFAVWALVMGLAGSWLATACWALASARLPLALAAQLIVAETVFGLAYGFLFEARWPVAAEWLGAALQLVGVTVAIRLFGRQRPPAVRLAAAGDGTAASPVVS